MYVAIYLFVLIVALFLILVVDKSQNQALRWVATIVPPLPLFYLITIPIDLGASPIWWIAGAIFLLSSLSVLVKFYFSLRQKYPSPMDAFRKLTRPSLAILAISTSYYFTLLSVASANIFVLEFTRAIQTRVDSGGNCPAKLDENLRYVDLGEDDTVAFWYGDYGTKYLVRYWCDSSNKTFSFGVKINQDKSFVVSSKPNETPRVRYGHIEFLQETTLDNGTELSALARKGAQ